jgi:hypothetical protein
LTDHASSPSGSPRRGGRVASGWAGQIVHGNDLVTEADAMHARLVRRLHERGGRAQGSEARELANIAALVGADETERWPVGNIPGRKG